MRRVKDTVPMQVAFRRALMFLSCGDRLQLFRPSEVGQKIWPDAVMTSQGYGGAATRVLSRLKKEALAEWHSNGTDCGWRITLAGRVWLRSA